jgi:hypothetical protein|tara:strand:+ start:335 stop:562 length:228 start_codon:yes stop_codon:yes gene_type:complete
MGFHRRHIDNNQVISLFRQGGINRVKDWYTRGADALVTESGLASDITEIMDKKMDETARWNLISDMVAHESIKTL